MSTEKFRDIRLSKKNREKLAIINRIIEKYQAQWYTLTLRQLYYQLVTENIIPNKQAEYAKLSTLLKEWRMAGIVDWEAIEDRLRIPFIPYSCDDPQDAISDLLSQYRLDRQEGQETYIEVWVEKDALSWVLKHITGKYHVRLLVNRWYGSITAIHDAYKRMLPKIRLGIQCKILYLWDHDPSWMDMIRDIQTRVSEMLMSADGFISLENKFWEDFFQNDDFMEWNSEAYENELYYYDPVIRYWDEESEEYIWDYTKAWLRDSFQVVPIWLTMEQIRMYNPPENPAKLTDPRAKWYIEKYGYSSWEVDALDPPKLNTLVSESIEAHMNMDTYEAILEREKEDKKRLEEVSDNIL